MGNTLTATEPSKAVREYLMQKGWWPPQNRSEEPDHLYLDCPFCEGHRLTMEITEGLWDCKTCGESGNLITLKKRLGDTYAINTPTGRTVSPRGPRLKQGGVKPPMEAVQGYADRLWDDADCEPVREYLTVTRGLSEDVLRAHRVGAVRNHGKWWVSLVAFDEHGQPAHVKFRSVPPADREFRRWAGCATVLYRPPPGRPPLDRSRPLIICEGEMDLMALNQMGLDNVVTGTAGATQGWPDEWCKEARLHPEVYVALDAGDVGEAGSMKLSKAIGLAKCIRVRPPDDHKDWNDCLAAGVEAKVVQDSILEGGEVYRPDGVRSVGDYKAELVGLRMDPERTRGASTGWASLDALLGGIRPAEVTVITGDTAAGKTSFACALAYNVSRIHGWPTIAVPLETRGLSVVKKWACNEAGNDVTDLEQVTDGEFNAAFGRLESLPLYLMEHWGEVEVQRVADTVRWAAEAEGVKFVVLDHLHYMLGVIRDNERLAIDEAMKVLNNLALDTGVHIAVVVHPRNVESDSVRIQMAHLKGSSGIKQEAHNILAVWRRRRADRSRKADEATQTVVTVLKVRSEAGDEGRVLFNYDRASCQYREVMEIRATMENRAEPEAAPSDWWNN